MVEIKRVMEKDEKGIDRQIYPMTHWTAVMGLDEFIKGETPVLSVNGQAGHVSITKESLGIELANNVEDGLLESALYIKLQEMVNWYEETGKNLGDITAEQVPGEGWSE